jgi:small subunit ribosomal protein S6
MPAQPATYDLMVLLDNAAPDELRSKVLSDAETLIGRQGTIVGRHDWGTRTLAYEIRHHADADYHLLQFQGGADLLRTLDRTLRIADGVLRFRIVKLAPGTPAPPEVRPEVRPAATEDAEAAAPTDTAHAEAVHAEAAPTEAAPAAGDTATEAAPAAPDADTAGGADEASAPAGEPAAS